MDRLDNRTLHMEAWIAHLAFPLQPRNRAGSISGSGVRFQEG